MEQAKVEVRWDWVDSVRGLGIILVFYGHVLQKGFAPRSETVAEQLRFVYSFHMPLFFLLSGFFFKSAPTILPRVVDLVRRRLVPVVFFNLLLLPLWLWDESRGHSPLMRDAFRVVLHALDGRPELNWVTWFLVCLFTCEVVALIALPLVKGTGSRLAFGVASIVFGVFLCNRWVGTSAGLIRDVARSWFLGEAVVALGFYAVGHALWPAARWLGEHRRAAGAAFIVFASITLATFSRNPAAGEVVMLSAAIHGDALPFLVTALAGSAAAVALGIALPSWPWLRQLGRNSLPLLGLNGLFFHYLNPKLARVWHAPRTAVMVLGGTFVVSAVSLVMCVPAVRLMNRYVPRLVGRPARSSPGAPAIGSGAPLRA
jgi:fucose 4-O-acetylase-like acetyltransferase